MSNDIRNWAKTIKIGDRKAKSIFLELADCADDTGFCFPKVEDLAETLEMSVKTVERGLAFLEDKDRIERIEGKKNKGKFANKTTQILFTDDDKDYIHNLRQKRIKKQPSDRLTDGEKPSDKLTDGMEKPSDNLSENGSKPPVNLSDGDKNHPSICPKPPVNLTNGQFDALNISNKDVFKTSTKTSIEELGELRPPTPTELSASQKQEFNEGMKFLKETIGPYSDGGAQGKSLKWMLLNGINLTQIKKYLPRQIEEYGETYRSSYLTLGKDIFRWIEAEMPEEAVVYETTADDKFPEELPETAEIELIVVSPEENQKWGEIMRFIEKNLDVKIVESWFKPLKFEGIDDGEKQLQIRSTLVNKQWIENYYQELVMNALNAAGLGDFAIKWRVVEFNL